MRETSDGSRRIVIVGAGGHGREVFSVLRAAGCDCAGFVDDGSPDLALIGRLGARFLGPVDAAVALDADFVIGIGSGAVRRGLAKRLVSGGMTAASAVHPSVSIGPDVRWGAGFICCAHAVITTNVQFGEHVHVNVNATISHDCEIGSYTTVGPGANICGNVSLGDAVVIGAGAVVIQGRSVGDGTTIGAGAVVTSDIPAGVVAAGVPAKQLRR